MSNQEAVDALQEVIDEVFDGDALQVQVDADTGVLSVGLTYATQLEFSRYDIMEQMGIDLTAWTKFNFSQALIALSDLILKKVGELNG